MEHSYKRFISGIFILLTKVYSIHSFNHLFSQFKKNLKEDPNYLKQMFGENLIEMFKERPQHYSQIDDSNEYEFDQSVSNDERNLVQNIFSR